MSALVIMVVAFIGYILMYNLYGKFIGQKIFKLSQTATVPSVELEDGMDYVPTKKEVIFGHHFTSIAGTGPIVGPAIAIIWGWVPALIWVFFGSIFMGAVHDFGALIISMRNQGKSVADYTSKYVNARTRFFFFLVVFLELWIVIAIFGLVIAVVFSMYPSSVFPVWCEVAIALYLGHAIYKQGKNILTWSIIAVILMYITVFIGIYIPIKMPVVAGIPATGVWTIILLAYAFIASTLPVTTLLQPRDFINSHQLMIIMVLLMLGVLLSAFGGNLHIVAPAIQTAPAKAPPMWPFLFITIACGAISGFHSLVSSGTSAKQVRYETDSLFVGYGSMLMEGALATLVIIAVSAGIGMGYVTKSGETLMGVAAWTTHYSSWAAAAGLGSKIAAFVNGSANMIASTGLPNSVAVVIMGVFVASFAGTTLDSATRIQRYIVSELFGSLKMNFLTGKYIATFIAVATALALAFATGAGGKGALKLWPLFGAVNQTLAGLVLIIITVYLKTKGGMKWLISGIPAVFMMVMTIWALALNQSKFGTADNTLLQIVNGLILLLAIWIVVEGVIKFMSMKSDS
ncbi:carbon starvation protein A [Desulfobacula sp.]|uniref:carbon starvation CstA family protein n=1 Tax=Desulfobacula sp. TaxID=2593537 RepID=UPI0025BA469F|nr:carbon starvation protein A [Desulfobacula sp.]MBC2703231.1 carbon starvation protein A [Desulfobacula sp.]